MSILVFALVLFLGLVAGGLFPWRYLAAMIIAAAHLVPIALILLVIAWVIGSYLEQPPAHQRYQPVQSDDTLKRLDALYRDPSFRRNVGLN